MATTSAPKRVTSPKTTPSRRRTVKRRPRQDDNEPIVPLGGRLFNAAFAGFAMLAVFPLRAIVPSPEPAKTDMSAWRVGGHTKVRLTVITKDYERLTCASTQTFGDEHCEYQAPSQLFPKAPGDPVDDSKAHTIQPYRTYPDNQLILVAGVWSHPEIATRLHREPWAGIPDQRQMRFVAECDVEFLGQVQNVKLRWQPDQDWVHEPSAWVGKARTCRIGDTD
jgi:hypothetical protein